jgi:hypothetical protein
VPRDVIYSNNISAVTVRHFFKDCFLHALPVSPRVEQSVLIKAKSNAEHFGHPFDRSLHLTAPGFHFGFPYVRERFWDDIWSGVDGKIRTGSWRYLKRSVITPRYFSNGKKKCHLAHPMEETAFRVDKVP